MVLYDEINIQESSINQNSNDEKSFMPQRATYVEKTLA